MNNRKNHEKRPLKTTPKTPQKQLNSDWKNENKIKKVFKSTTLVYTALNREIAFQFCRDLKNPDFTKSAKNPKKTYKNSENERFLVFLKAQIECLLNHFTWCLRAIFEHTRNIAIIGDLPDGGL